MLWLKRLLMIGLSGFMIKLDVDLLRLALNVNPQEVGHGTSIFLGFFLSLTLTGVFAFVGFVFPTSNLLPDGYYRVRNHQKLNRLAELMQIEWFRKFLLVFFWGGRNRKRFFSGKRSGLVQMAFETRQAEFGHSGGFLLTLPFTVILLIRGLWMWVLALQFFNLVGNIYPMVLQRLHRSRLQRMIKL